MTSSEPSPQQQHLSMHLQCVQASPAPTSAAASTQSPPSSVGIPVTDAGQHQHHLHHQQHPEFVHNNNNNGKGVVVVLSNHNNNDSPTPITTTTTAGSLTDCGTGGVGAALSANASSSTTYLSCCSNLSQSSSSSGLLVVNGQSGPGSGSASVGVPLKISDNHLSTKLVRNSVAPYPTTRVARASPPRDDVVDSVGAVNSDDNNRILANSSSQTMGSTGGGSISGAGVICGVNGNAGLKMEPNGNSIEINSVDNQLHPQHHHHLSGGVHHMPNGGGGGGVGAPCCSIPTPHQHHRQPHQQQQQQHQGPMIHFGSTTTLVVQNGVESKCDLDNCSSAANGAEMSNGNGVVPMETSSTFACRHESNHCNHHCNGGGSSSSSPVASATNTLVPPANTSAIGMTISSSSSNNGSSSNGQQPSAGSNMSPGENDDEHDCDDDKVINGDTFGAAGELPDPDSIKMFVGQIPKQMNETDLRELFEKYGRVYQINVLRDKVTKQSKGCCFVTFFTRKAALDAQNALHNIKTLPGMNNTMQVKPADNENRYDRKLFIGMISKKLNETDVRNMFSRFGTIEECTVLRLPNGESKGCAFVTFAQKQSAANAIKAVHQSITMEGCSSAIVVKFADTPKDKDQKRQSQLVSNQANLLNTYSSSAMTPVPQQYYSILPHHLQQQQQPQQGGFFSQLSPLGVQGITGIGGLGSTSATGLPGLGSPLQSTTNVDLALATTALLSSVTQNPVAAQNLATLAALGNSLSPSGANGSSVGSGNSVANLTGNGLHSGLSSYHSGLRPAAVAVNTKQLEGPEGCNLFIYHLPPEFGDADLATMFSTYGNVLSAKVFVDKQTNLSKCFGFVSFDNQVSAQMAIQAMHGFQIGPKRLKVQLKRSKSKDAAKPY